ncbi:MAG: hypothetical protein KY453_03770 [Gemmatimonadetes bacterium]|nr:hypothetical protein [Gemmatimonadota bacterium]
MDTTRTQIREVAFPAAALAGLRRALRDEAGPLAAVHALHAAGYDAGGRLFEAFTGGGDPRSRDEHSFWRGLSDFLDRRGWGTLEHSVPHPGIGLLSSPDWAEALPEGSEHQPACAFGSGLLSSVLSRAADGPVAVLEVACRSRGDDRCTFAFGSEAAVHELYGLLLEGRDLDRALAEL